MKIGAQLYTVRDFVKNIEDVRETFKKIAAIGYKSIQVSGFGDVDDQEVADAAVANGLEITITHCAWDSFKNDLDYMIKKHQIFNCKHLAIGGVPREYIENGEWQKFIDELTPIAKRLADEGMDFSYHNHNQEFLQFDGKPWLAHLYDNAPTEVLSAELDLYWVTAGGGNPEAWVRKVAGRMPVAHFKDMCIHEWREQRYAPIGEGNLDWDGIIAACNETGVEYAMVEQDDCYGRDPFDCLASSYNFLKSKGLD